MQLCPDSTWRGEPSLPSRACKHSMDLIGRAYQACGEAASALHAMALLQVHQAKALRDLHWVVMVHKLFRNFVLRRTSPLQICVSPSEPTCTDLVQSQGGRGAGPSSCAILAQSDLVPRTHAACDTPSLANPAEEEPSFSEMGHPLAPVFSPLETPCLVPKRTESGGSRWLTIWGA